MENSSLHNVSPDTESDFSQIPIRNIYYLLCYAWNCLEEQKNIEVGSENQTELIDLFARVLTRGVGAPLRSGLDRGYLGVQEVIPGIKGRLLIADSLKAALFRQGKATCAFDDFSYDVLHNRIINETLLCFLRTDGLSPQNATAIRQILFRLPTLTPLPLTSRVFQSIRLTRNNSHYRFLLNICELAFNCMIPTEDDLHFHFRNFLRDKAKMAVLFETFVRNYFKISHPELKPKRSEFSWQLTPLDQSNADFLPEMETDITLRLPNRTVIIDTKYYQNTLNIRESFDSKKLHSSNLYQMFSYLLNADPGLPRPLTGILLYPTVGHELNEAFQLPTGDRIEFRTVDLSMGWREIEERLMGVVGNWG